MEEWNVWIRIECSFHCFLIGLFVYCGVNDEEGKTFMLLYCSLSTLIRNDGGSCDLRVVRRWLHRFVLCHYHDRVV